MKYIKLLIAVTILLNIKIICQQTYPVAIGGGLGIFVELSNSSGSFIVERSESPFKSWEEVGKTSNPSSVNEFSGRLSSLHSQFSDFSFPDEKQINQIWNIWQRTNRIDSIPYWGNMPLIKISLGTMFLDSAAGMKKEYQYSVSSTENTQKKEFTNSVSFPKSFYNNEINFHFSTAETNQILLEFRTTGEQYPSAFRLLRKDNGKGSFENINTAKGFNETRDTLSLFAVDTSVTPYNFYNYFILPLDLFGNEGTASDTIFIGAYNFNNVPLPHNLQIESGDSTDAFRISWILPDTGGVVGVKIFRSEIFDSGFVQIALVSPKVDHYVDLMVEPMKRYYYYLQLTGPLGELSPTTARFGGFHHSSIAPIPPAEVKAESIANGVKLQWKNTDDFVEGFWVYRSNGFSDSLSLISSLIKEEKPVTFFADTSEELSGMLTYYYSIRSASTSHVLSNFSDTVAIRPELKTLPPAPTGLTVFQLDDNSLKISWDDMTEIESSVGYYIVFRRTTDPSEKNIPEFQPIVDSALTAGENYFRDSTAEAGKSYEYAVMSVDLFGGTSEMSNPVSFNNYFSEITSPAGLNVSRQPDGVMVKWDPVMQDNIAEYKIYRQQRGSEKEFLGSVKNGKPLQMIDRGVTNGELYFYSVTAVADNQMESAPSYSISIRP